MKEDTPPGALERAVECVSVWLAIGGGVLLLAVAGLVTVSVVQRWLTSRAIAGDFEMVQIGLAIVVFAFLPICQLRGANIFVDVMTARASPRVQAALDRLWALAYAAVAGLIAWGLVVGALDTMASRTTSMVLGLPFGWAILLCAVLAAWLALVTLITLARTVRGRRP